MKALATFDVIVALPRLARERRAIQATRRIDAATFAGAMTAELSSPYIGGPAHSGWVRRGLGLYWALVCSLLRASSRSA